MFNTLNSRQSIMNSSVDSNFIYFKENHGELVKQYPDKYLVISQGAVIQAADTLEDALNYTIEKNMIPGEFIIQQCVEGDSANTQMFHSRAIFR